jgi:hypothetical protein
MSEINKARERWGEGGEGSRAAFLKTGLNILSALLVYTELHAVCTATIYIIECNITENIHKLRNRRLFGWENRGGVEPIPAPGVAHIDRKQRQVRHQQHQTWIARSSSV